MKTTRGLRTVALRAGLLVLAACAAPSAADAADFGLTLDGGFYHLTNSPESAEAIFEASGAPVFGAAVQYALGRSLFLRVGARFTRMDGERVFVASPDAPVFRLGHPLTARIVPVYGLIGYGFGRGSLRPYLALGGGVTMYDEESEVAGEIFESTATKPSGHFAGGVDYGRGSFRFGAEVMYTLAPDVIGDSGVSEVYNENDMGGVTGVLRITFVP